MAYERNQLKKLFPNLYREIVAKKMSFTIGGVRASDKRLLKTDDGLPGPIDYLRRCNNDKEAEEVIEFLERTNQLTKEEASTLKDQLKKHGVRSFGSKKELGYYSRELKEE